MDSVQNLNYRILHWNKHFKTFNPCRFHKEMFSFSNKKTSTRCKSEVYFAPRSFLDMWYKNESLTKIFLDPVSWNFLRQLQSMTTHKNIKAQIRVVTQKCKLVLTATWAKCNLAWNQRKIIENRHKELLQFWVLNNQ